MDDDITQKILAEVKEAEQTDDERKGQEIESSLCFFEKGYTPVKFSPDNFHTIDNTDCDVSENKDRKITFIDGGNAELFSSPSTCVHFIRIFHTTYQDNKRISCGADEFYVVAKTLKTDETMLYTAKLFKERASLLTESFFSEDIFFHPLDRSIMDGNSRADISKVPGMVRRMAELSTALLMTRESKNNDIIVIDGDLNAKVADEAKLINALGVMARDRKSFACGLSKTSRLISSDGRSVIDILNKHAPVAPWYYHPAAVAADTDAKVCFVKFHRSSDYIFKLESFGACEEPNSTLLLLAANSTDPVFIGYPYGLVEADRFARVSNRDAEILRTTFMARAGNDWEQIEASAKALDAHSVLDSI